MSYYVSVTPSLLGRYCETDAAAAFDPERSGNRYCEAAASEVTVMDRLPILATDHTSYDDLFANAGHRPRLRQDSGVPSLSRLEDIYFDSTNFFLFTRDHLFIEPFTRLDARSSLETVNWASTDTIAPFSDNLMVCDQQDNLTGAVHKNYYVQGDLFDRARRVEETCVLLANHGTTVYYHWLLEGLTRTWYLERFPELNRYRLLMPGVIPQYAGESLSHYGVSSDRLAQLDGGIYHFKTLLVPSLLVPCQDASPRSITYLQRHAPQVTNSSLPRRFYITRTDAITRQVGNEAAILAALAPLGVVPVQLSGMSFAEQVALFRQAELIVAPHGGGLANMAYGQGAAVVELSPRRWHPCFWYLSNLTAGRHIMVVAVNELQRLARHPYVFRTGTNPLRMEFDPAHVVAGVEIALSGR